MNNLVIIWRRKQEHIFVKQILEKSKKCSPFFWKSFNKNVWQCALWSKDVQTINKNWCLGDKKPIMSIVSHKERGVAGFLQYNKPQQSATLSNVLGKQSRLWATNVSCVKKRISARWRCVYTRTWNPLNFRRWFPASILSQQCCEIIV